MMIRKPLKGVACALAAFGLTVTSAVAGPGPSARVTVDCSISGSVMTITVDAKSKGGGKPQHIDSAGPVIMSVTEKVGRTYRGVTGLRLSMAETGLPATARFDLCTATGSRVNSESRSVKGLGSAFIPNVGFVSKECSPDKPPAC